eukprot:jgi/Chlat1/8687/Chrsp88S08064
MSAAGLSVPQAEGLGRVQHLRRAATRAAATAAAVPAVPAVPRRSAVLAAYQKPSENADTTRAAATPSRRDILGLVAVVAPAMACSRAFALLPDDDDEDLLQRAKSRRKERLEVERATERSFVREEGFAKGQNSQNDTAYVQKFVNALGRAGGSLERGDFSGVADAVGSSPRAAMVVDTSRALKQLSQDNAAAQEVADEVLGSVAQLQRAAAGKKEKEAKKQFLAVILFLQKWVDLTKVPVAGL